jgi:periplasmic protein TonB
MRALPRIERLARFVRANAVATAAALVLVALAALAVRWIARSREAPPPRKVMQFTVVNVQAQPPPKAPPPPPPQQQQQKVQEEQDQPQTQRVELKAAELPPPDAPPPTPGGGRLALAAEGEGPGDAFNLAGNAGGRGLLSGGGLGGGSGEGVGDGVAARYGWYFGRIASQIQDAFQRLKKTRTAEARVEIKVWVDPGGRVARVQLQRSTGDEELDREIQSVVGVQLRDAPPPELPNPAIYRFTARRPR